MEIRKNIGLAPLTTFKVGGPAKYFCEAKSLEDIQEAYAFACDKNINVIVLGGGSNMIVPDAGLDALVLKIANKGMRRLPAAAGEGTKIICAAGETLLSVVRYAAGQGLGGLENLAGIPGTAGGAVRGNAGAFSTEIKDVLVSAKALDIEHSEEKIFKNSECGFAYRTSYFKQHANLILLEVEFALARAEPMELDKKIMHTLAERNRRHIQDIKSAGSFFKNPVVSKELQELFEKEKGAQAKEGRVPAGWLMDKTGLRGARVGDAVASEHHTNYFLNAGSATSKEVLTLGALAKEKVLKNFGVQLEEEVSIL